MVVQFPSQEISAPKVPSQSWALSDLSACFLPPWNPSPRAAWTFKSQLSIRAPAPRERPVINISLDAVASVLAWFLLLAGSWDLFHALLHAAVSTPPCHLLPTPPSFEVGPLGQGLPYMGTTPNGSRSLAGAVTRESVNKGAEGN